LPDLDFESNDTRFEELDKVVRRLIDQGRVPDQWVFGKILVKAAVKVDPIYVLRHSVLTEDIGVLDVRSTYSSTFCIRRWVTFAGQSALSTAQRQLIAIPAVAAHVRRVKQQLMRLVKDLSDFDRFVSNDLLIEQLRTTESSMIDQDEFEAIRHRIAGDRATAALARSQLRELAEDLREPPPLPITTGRSDDKLYF
jgi:hypothetical protein